MCRSAESQKTEAQTRWGFDSFNIGSLVMKSSSFQVLDD